MLTVREKVGINSVLEDKRIFLDSAILIYYIEEHSRYIKYLDNFFNNLEDGLFKSISSILTLTEILVAPMQNNDDELITSYKDILLNSKNLYVININEDISIKASRLRADYGYRIPDAIQLSAAILTGCDHFLTNDKRLKSNKELSILVLDEIVQTS